MIEELKQNLLRQVSTKIEDIFATIKNIQDKTELIKLDVENDIKNSEIKVKTLLSTLDILENKKKSIESSIKDLKPIEDKIVLLQSRIYNSEDQIDLNNKKLVSLQKDSELLEKELTDKRGVLAHITSQIDSKMKLVIPTIEELKKREQRIKEVESGLAIIEQRWKKMYSDHGVNFKI